VTISLGAPRAASHLTYTASHAAADVAGRFIGSITSSPLASQTMISASVSSDAFAESAHTRTL
jgi:hypothetical protein